MTRTACSYLTLACVCLILYFAYLGQGDLAGESEGNYAEIPREMLETGEWIIPQLDYVPYLEKPPLFYWATALTYKAIGANAFSARLWSALSALLLVFSVFFFVRRLRGEESGLYSALILATSAGMIAMARISYMDMLLCLCTAWAFFGFYLAENGKKIWHAMFFVSLALAVLTKGLIGVALPGIGILLYIAMQRRWTAIRRIPWLWGIPLFLAIALPWHVLAGIKNERFFWFYFINEHVLRFLGRRMPQDYYEGAFYYQFLRVALLFFPWTLCVPLLFFRKVKEFFTDRLSAYLFCWFLAFLFFYTASKAKANYYMMPALPALAMLVGIHLRERIWAWALGKGWRALMALFLGVSLGLYGLLVFYPYPLLKKMAAGAYPFLLCAVFIAALVFLLSFLCALKRNNKASFACLITGITLGWLPLFAKDQIFERRGSVQPLIGLIEANLGSETLLALRGTFEKNSLLAFYLKRRFMIVSEQGDVGGDLDFGSRFPANKPYFLQWGDFLQRFGGKEKILYVTYKDADYDELLGNHPSRCRLITRCADRLLISNFPPKALKASR